MRPLISCRELTGSRPKKKKHGDLPVLTRKTELPVKKYCEPTGGCTPPKCKGSTRHSCLTAGRTKKGSDPTSCNTTPRKLPGGFHTRTQLPRFEVDVLVSVSWVLHKPLTAFCCLCPLLCRVSAWYTATSKMDYPYDHLFKHQRLLD